MVLLPVAAAAVAAHRVVDSAVVVHVLPGQDARPTGAAQRARHKLGTEEGNILFNDALNTFYLWLYGVRDNRSGG